MNGGLRDEARPSLLGRARVAAKRPWRVDRVALALALLLALGPMATIVGAMLAEMRVRDAIARGQAADRSGENGAPRAELSTLVARPGIGGTLEGLARALPQDATLLSVERGADGAMRLEATTPDPDRLRATLRRDTATGDLREAGQRAGDGAMIVTFEGRR